MTRCKSSALSIVIPLIFVIHLVNGAHFWILLKYLNFGISPVCSRFWYFSVIDYFIYYVINCVLLIIDNFLFSAHEFRTTCFIDQIQYFIIFHCLYYSVTINESKKSFRIVFWRFSAWKTFLRHNLLLVFL